MQLVGEEQLPKQLDFTRQLEEDSLSKHLDSYAAVISCGKILQSSLMQSQSQLLMSTFSHIFTCNCVRTSHAHFHSLFQLFALFPARMEALAPNQIPAHVLWDGVGLHAVKVSMTQHTFLSGEYVCTHAQDACAYNFCCDTLLRCITFTKLMPAIH